MVCVHLSVSRAILCVLCVRSVNECRKKSEKKHISVSFRRSALLSAAKTVTFWPVFGIFPNDKFVSITCAMKIEVKIFHFFLFSPLSICFVADYFTVDGAT